MKSKLSFVPFMLTFFIGTATGVGISKPIYAKTKRGYSVYKANVNNHDVICDIIERQKNCYDMHKCEDGNNYICVTNIEISKD
jgi:hypothetical protein